MAKRDEHTFDFLTGREGDFMETVMNELADTPWAKPLIDGIIASGGLTGDNKAKLFELRFGYDLNRAGIQPSYEVAGEGQSSLDFGFNAGGHDFLVEMMRLEETDAVRAATTVKEYSDGAVMVGRHLGTSTEDARQASQGDRHVYASRTRFIPELMLGLFERRVWPFVTSDAVRASQGPRVDIGARMRGMWR